LNKKVKPFAYFNRMANNEVLKISQQVIIIIEWCFFLKTF
jgi:hypothetical protein